MYMQKLLSAGKYVVAVSGGVDSVVLLNMLAAQADQEDLSLVVAHFDHGIRPDSAEDSKFVERLARSFGLQFVSGAGELGEGASEAKAREARYAFLRSVQQAVKADAIVTAHHQDDVLETIIINLLRGTKSRGLSSLRSTDQLRRPLLGVSKAEIRAYAKSHNLQWHEDSTNEDETYLRNYIRKYMMPRLSEADRQQLLEHSEKAAALNDSIHELTMQFVHGDGGALLDRAKFRSLPPEVASEVMAAWLREHTDATLTSKLIDRLSQAVIEARNGALIDIARGKSLKMSRDYAKLITG